MQSLYHCLIVWLVAKTDTFGGKLRFCCGVQGSVNLSYFLLFYQSSACSRIHQNAAYLDKVAPLMSKESEFFIMIRPRYYGVMTE